MSDLIAIAYDDAGTADRVRTRLFELQKERVISLEDAVVVERTDGGKVRLRQSVHPAGAGAAGGALWGGLIGLLFLAPFLGMALGAAGGAAAGAMSDYGVSNDLMRRLGQELRPGGGALFVLVHSVTPDKVLPEVREFGGTVMQTSLDEGAEARLRDALGDGAPAPA